MTASMAGNRLYQQIVIKLDLFLAINHFFCFNSP